MIKRRLHIQTDHVFFAPGGTIFFKVYLVKGADKQTSLSKLSVDIVYTEIFGPSGRMMRSKNKPTRQKNGYSEGFPYTLSDQAAGGIYRIKAYTSWMKNEKRTAPCLPKRLPYRTALSPPRADETSRFCQKMDLAPAIPSQPISSMRNLS